MAGWARTGLLFSISLAAVAVLSGCVKDGSFVQCKSTKLGYITGCKTFKSAAEAKRRCVLVGGAGGSSWKCK